MKLEISFEEIVVLGSATCATAIALGIAFGRIGVREGGFVVVSLCGGTVLIKVLKALKRDL